MSKLPSLSTTQVIRALRKAGFVEAPLRGRGSHKAFCRKDTERTRLVIVPQGKHIPKGTLLAILAQAGLSREEFLKLL